MADEWDDPAAKAWARHVIEDMVPKLEGSAVSISLVPDDRVGDVKYWVELGASIMLGKPIVVVVLGDTPLPPKLEQIADEIVRAPEGVDLATSQEFAAALTRAVEKEAKRQSGES